MPACLNVSLKDLMLNKVEKIRAGNLLYNFTKQKYDIDFCSSQDVNKAVTPKSSARDSIMERIDSSTGHCNK